MIARICREHGLYLLMLVAVAAMQLIFSYGGLEDFKSVAAQHESSLSEAQRFEQAVAPLRAGKIPLALFVAGIGIILIFGSGLVTDVVFFMKWLLAKSAGKDFLCVREKGPGPWALEDLFKLFILFFFSVSCLHSIIYLAISEKWIARGVVENFALFLNSIGLYAVVLLTLVLWMRKRKEAVAPALGFSPSGFSRNVRLGLAAYLGFVPLLLVLLLVSLLLCQAFGIEPQAHELVEILTKERSPLRLAFLGSLTMVLGPLVEEIVFRGVAYSAMRKRWGMLGSAAGSSLMFAFAHANAAQTLPIFGMGMMLAVLYEHTGSLIASVTFHVLNNALAFALTVLVLSLMR